MFMVKFSPTALNFGYDFVLVVYFWDTLYNPYLESFTVANIEFA